MSTRLPQYRLLARLLREVTSELMIKSLDEQGIRLPGTERRRQRLIDKMLPVMERLNARGVGLGNRPLRPRP